MVTIPSGHPLYNLLGTQYQSVIEEYLGSTAGISSTYCTLHNEFYQDPNPPVQDSQASFPEARQVLTLADNLLATLDPGSAMYQAVQNAADYLRMLLGADYPNQAEIMAAIEALTRAMGGMY